ncbi:MAG: hypothetical protein AAGB26_16410 [Planctomycetota bacterium]
MDNRQPPEQPDTPGDDDAPTPEQRREQDYQLYRSLEQSEPAPPVPSPVPPGPFVEISESAPWWAKLISVLAQFAPGSLFQVTIVIGLAYLGIDAIRVSQASNTGLLLAGFMGMLIFASHVVVLWFQARPIQKPPPGAPRTKHHGQSKKTPEPRDDTAGEGGAR